MTEILLASICAVFYLAVKLNESKPNKVQYYYKWYCYYVYILIMTPLCCCIYVWRGRTLNNLPGVIRWMAPLTRMHGVRWHVQNTDVLHAPSRAVVISNHQSCLDVLGMMHAAQSMPTWIPTCKKEMVYLGPVGLLLYLVGAVFIDRKRPREAYQNLDQAVDRMIKEDLKIWLFPEGTRNMQKTMLPFKRGAFNIAVRSQSPIIPVVYSPYYFAYEDQCIFENNGNIIMRCLDPIPTTGLTMDDIPKLMEHLHKIILNEYEQLSKEVLHKFSGAAQSLALAK